MSGTWLLRGWSICARCLVECDNSRKGMGMVINIPESPVPPSRRNPQCLLLYGGSKAGKTTGCASLPDSLILELEPNGADFVAARKIDITGMPHLLANARQTSVFPIGHRHH